MALRTILASSKVKDKPVFLHFDTPKKENLKDGHINLDLNKIMQNIGSEQFAYGTFTVAFDEDPRIKEMVKNFNETGIELNSEDSVSVPDQPEGGDEVEQMAKRATDVGADL